MILQNSPSRAELASTTSTREGALLIGTDSKTHLGSSTTVEAALTALDARAVQYVDLAAAGPGILFQASLGAPITVVASGVSATELGYLDGVTAPIQTQIDGKLSLSGGTLTGALTLNADPSNSLHAATKQYVDALGNGIKWKPSVRAATTTNGTLASAFVNGTTHDGVTMSTGDRLLIKHQTMSSENGIYIVPASGAPARASDADAFGELNGAVVMVLEGTANGDKGFMQIAELTSLSDNQTWIQNFGTGLFVADESTLTLSGSTFSVKALGITNAQVSASAAIAHSKMAALTASRAIVSDSSGFASVSATTSTEVGYLSGVTSPIQTQLDAKQATITGGASTVTGSDLTISRALRSNSSGKIAVSPTTDTELALLSGVTGTLTTNDGVQTLTNKTLTNPKISSAILDLNGDELLKMNASSTPVNEVTITARATGNGPRISATGDDSNIHLHLQPKGSGSLVAEGPLQIGTHYLSDANDNELLKFGTTASAINEITITNAATGNNPKISATGGNSNIGISYQTKGAGFHTFLNALFQAPVSLTYSATVNIDWSQSNFFEILLTGDVTFTYSNFATGAWIVLRVQQDGSGNRDITYPAVATKFDGGANVLATAGNHVDYLLIVCRAGPTFDVIRFGPDLF